jgi:hypothetical protein
VFPRSCAGRRILAGTAPPLVALVIVVLLGLALVPIPASAHPFGEPQTVRLSAEGSMVTLRWTAAPDDLILLGGAVGALPSRRTFVIDTSPGSNPAQVGPSHAEMIESSQKVAAYLADHLRVRQDGRECTPEMKLEGFVAEGARVVFACPRAVTDVDVEITMLTDLHDAYRTVALGDGTTTPDRALYTLQRPVQTWSFGTAGIRNNRNTGLQSWLAVGAMAALVMVGAGSWRRARIRRSSRSL